MNFNNSKEIKVSGGIAVPLNPYKEMSDLGIFASANYAIFEIWLFQQPTILSNAANGIYPVGEFGEVKKQIFKRGMWATLIGDFEPKDKGRYFLPYIGPKKQERQAPVYGPGNDNYGRDKPFYEQPATPEQKGVELGEEIRVNLGFGLSAHLHIDSSTVFFSHYNVAYAPGELTFDQIEKIHQAIITL